MRRTQRRPNRLWVLSFVLSLSWGAGFTSPGRPNPRRRRRSRLPLPRPRRSRPRRRPSRCRRRRARRMSSFLPAPSRRGGGRERPRRRVQAGGGSGLRRRRGEGHDTLTLKDWPTALTRWCCTSPVAAPIGSPVSGKGGKIFVDLTTDKGLGVGLITVSTEPPDARVDVDGQRAGLSPLELPWRAAGTRCIFRRSGFKEVDLSVDVARDARKEVSVRLEPRRVRCW